MPGIGIGVGLQFARPSGGQSLAARFADGADKALWYDRTNAVFQDAAGTTAATTGDPIGHLANPFGSALTQTTAGSRPTLVADGIALSGTAFNLLSPLEWTIGNGIYMIAACTIPAYGGGAGARPLIGIGNGSSRRLDLSARYDISTGRQAAAYFRDVTAQTIVGAANGTIPVPGVPFVIEGWVVGGVVTLIEPVGTTKTATPASITPEGSHPLYLGFNTLVPMTLHAAAARQGAGVPDASLRAAVRAEFEALAGI